MALKPDRSIDVPEDISYFCNTTGSRGCVVVYDTSAGGGSGAAMDNPNAVAKILSGSGASGTIPIGMLMNDVVNKDLTQTHINYQKDEVQVGNKIAIMRKGWAVTNAVSGTPTVGAKAYYNDLSQFCTDSNANGSVLVGRFLSKLDADGYAKVYVDCGGTAN